MVLDHTVIFLNIMAKGLSEQMKMTIVTLREAGKTNGWVAKHLKLPSETTSRVWTRYKTSGTVKRSP